MPFKYKPEDAKDNFTPLEPGVYQFTTVSAEESVSKTNKDMIILTINIFDLTGNRRQVKFYITNEGLFNLKKYWESVGSPEMFEEQAEFFSGIKFEEKSGWVKTGVEEHLKDGSMQRYTKILKFLSPEEVKKISIKKDESFEDEIIPF